MIYVSTAGIKKSSVIDIIDELIGAGINSIELSGGTEPIDNLDEKILNYQKKNINFYYITISPPQRKTL
jgi:hypothetical protein